MMLLWTTAITRVTKTPHKLEEEEEEEEEEEGEEEKKKEGEED